MVQVTPQFGILGPGAVGGFLASLLTRKQLPVTCIGRKEWVDLANREGLQLKSAEFGHLVAKVNATTKLNRKLDYLFVTTKAYSLRNAIESIPRELVTGAKIIPLLNGFEHLEILAKHFPQSKVFPAMIGKVELKREKPTVVLHTNNSVEIEIGCEPEDKVDLNELVEILKFVGVPTLIRPNIKEVYWTKLVRLNALACVNAVSGLNIGAMRTSPEWRKVLSLCVNEAVTVASAEGVVLEPNTVMETIDKLPAHINTSLKRDFDLGGETEVDSLAGAIIRVGHRYQLGCPTIEGLSHKIARMD